MVFVIFVKCTDNLTCINVFIEILYLRNLLINAMLRGGTTGAYPMDGKNQY